MSDSQVSLTPADGDDVLAAEYVLGVLSAAERAVVAKRAEQEHALAAQIAAWQAHLMAFDTEFVAAKPPSNLKVSVDKRLFAESRSSATGWWHSLAFWRSAALASAAIAVVAGGVALYQPSMTNDAGTITVATLSAATPGETFSIVYNASIQVLTVSRATDEAIDGNDFELWVIVGDDAPVSLGVVPPTGSGVLPLTADKSMLLQPTSVLAISLEPVGGSPTGAPTGPVLSAGELKDI